MKVTAESISRAVAGASHGRRRLQRVPTRPRPALSRLGRFAGPSIAPLTSRARLGWNLPHSGSPALAPVGGPLPSSPRPQQGPWGNLAMDSERPPQGSRKPRRCGCRVRGRTPPLRRSALLACLRCRGPASLAAVGARVPTPPRAARGRPSSASQTPPGPPALHARGSRDHRQAPQGLPDTLPGRVSESSGVRVRVRALSAVTGVLRAGHGAARSRVLGGSSADRSAVLMEPVSRSRQASRGITRAARDSHLDDPST